MARPRRCSGDVRAGLWLFTIGLLLLAPVAGAALLAPLTAVPH